MGEEKSRLSMKALPIQLYTERCLDSRHYQAKCSYCVDNCPAGAIQIKNRTIALDDPTCTGCGLCLSACPMEVFTTRNWSERLILEHLAGLRGERAELLCANHPDSESRTDRPEILKLNVCLAAISPGLLFEAGLVKQIDLRIDACEKCTMGRAMGHMENSAGLANAWLSSVGREHSIALSVGAAPEAAGPKPGKKNFRFRTPVEADEGRVNRRDFLSGFARQGSSLFAVFLCITPAKAGLGDGHKSAHSFKQPHVPKWREKLSIAYPKQPCVSGLAALWPHIQVSDACRGCVVCEKYCPTRALHFRAEEGRLIMRFTAGLCADCGLCALACPVGAVTRGYRTQEKPFDAQVVLDDMVAWCHRCNAPILKSGDPLCYWCASEPPLEPLLEGAKRLLFTPDEDLRDT